jgi:hypothetical protein
MYMVRVAGFRPGRGVITEPVKPAHGARLDVWRTDPRDRRPVPAPGRAGALFSTTAFALKNSGNRTLRAETVLENNPRCAGCQQPAGRNDADQSQGDVQ